MKTINLIIVAVTVLFFSFNVSAQENISAVYNQTIQPITISSVSNSYEAELRKEYNNLLGMFLTDDDIEYKRKVEMTSWEETVTILNSSDQSGNNVVAYLIFPKGVLTIYKDFSTVLSLHESFNKWAGKPDHWWNIFGTDLRYQYTYNR
jgi:hypothetical protein